MSATVEIPGRFNGPLDSGNGGYCSGVVASFVEEPAVVSLLSPAPLDRPLDVAAGDEGVVRVRDDKTVVAEGRPGAAVDLDVPAPVDRRSSGACSTARPTSPRTSARN